jgi:hypothetical protein
MQKNTLNSFSLSNSRRRGQTYFPAPGMEGFILFDKIDINDINDKFVIRRIYQVFRVSYLVFCLTNDVLVFLCHQTPNNNHQTLKTNLF